MLNSPNMSYCQFENTLAAMQQCMETLSIALDDGEKLDFSSAEEKRAFMRMQQQCEEMMDLIDQYHDVVANEEESEAD